MGEANFYYFTCLKFGYRNKKMGISQAKWHKKRKTGGKRPTYKKKRKYELGRPASMTKIGAYRVHLVRVRGGNIKRRALRLDTGNFSWGSEGSPVKLASSTPSTTPATTSWCVPRPS